MILRLLLFASILMLFCINNIYGALNVAKLNLNPQQQQNGDSKQHRHSMDQLEPDLAQTIFGGIQRNPLERTTTAKPKAIAIIKSPTLRGKRDTLPEIKLADVKHLGNDDPLPEQSPKKEADYENINADSRENSKSEAVEATTTVDLIFDERINLSGDSENKNETIIDSEIAVVTSGPLEESAATPTSTLSATVSKSQGMVVQEVAAPTPKYNLTQNDNSPTENLDRKILAFEINSHNRKVFEELQKKKSAAIAAKMLENPEFNFEEETEAETPVFLTTTITPIPAANEVQIDESKKLLNEVSFNKSPKTLTLSLPSIIQEATKEEVENAPENPATSESKAQEIIQTLEQLTQPNEQPENTNEQLPTLTASVPVEAEAGVIESEVNVKNAESPTEGDVQFSKSGSQESSPEVPDHLKHQTEVPAATPITEAAGSHSKEEFTTPQTSFPEGDFILPQNSEALHHAELLAEANAAKVGSIQFPSQLPSIFYEKASQKKKVPKISQQQQQPPPAPHQETQPPPPPPPTDAQIQGFLLPHRPILDSSVQKRRHLISNYINPIQQQKSAQLQQKQEFFRKSAVIARERSRRETKPEQTTVTYEDDVIDEADSGESNIIVRLTTNTEEDNPTTTTADKNVEDITATTAGVESSTSITREHELKLVSKKNGSKKNVLDNEVQKSTVVLVNEEHATVTSAESKTSESTDSASSSTIESTKPSEATTTTDEPTIPSEATTPKPIKKPKISKALTREEKLALLESQSPRTGINLGKIHLPKKSSTEAVDASAEPQDPENPWTHRFKSHIQLKLTDESREVVERTELKVLPKLISPEILKAQKKAEREAKKKAKKEAEEEELEFKDLPEPRSGDLKVDVDVVTKPATKSATLLTSTVTPTTSRPRVPQQFQQQIPQNFFVRPQQQFQQQPQQQFFQQQQQQQFFQPQQQQIFPQQRTQFPQQRIISIDGVRYILRDPAPQQQFLQPPPQQFFQPQQFQQQQFFQQPPPPPLRAPPSHSPPPAQQPSMNSTQKIKPHRIIHSGNAKQFSTTPAPTTPTLGPRVNPEDLSVVRIFEHRGTTKQIIATTPAPTTRPPSTTAYVTESTTQWIPVTFTTHPTPTTPFDIFLITTAAPISNSRVKTHRDHFEVYDEVEFSDPTTTTSKPKKIKKLLPRSRTSPSTKRQDPSDFDLISEVAQEQSFRDIPLRHPPNDPPSTNFEDYFDDQQRKSLRRKQPKLVRLNNSNAAISQKAADFIGDVPFAKSDLRGLDKTIALNS